MSLRSHFKNELSMQGSSLKGLIAYFTEPKRRGLFYYRLAKESYDKGRRICPKLLQNKLLTTFGCDISLTATLGKNVRLRHINGIVIGKGVTIGDDTILYHQVTIGGKNLGDAQANNYPVIGKNVTIFAGAKVIGGIKVGDGAVIGANSVVLHDVEPYAVVAGMPARQIGTRSTDS